jgi:23S rRNA pseudouridine2605 synthase
MRKASGSQKKNLKPQSGDKKTSFPKDKKPFQKFTKEVKPKSKPEKDSDELRLNRYIANSGVCSRRDADLYIKSGNVKVNGEVITEMGYKVKISDKVNFDGVEINPEKKEYILLNKPKNFSTEKNDNGATNVLQLIKGATTGKMEPVGRMDKTTTGLLLFTNDKELILKLSKPNQRTSKLYQVSLDKNLKFEDLEKIQTGITLEGHKVMVEEVSYIENEAKSEIGIKMKTANIKLVRHIFEKLKYNVIKLDRVLYAGLTKKNLPRGNYRFLTDQEIINLRNNS